MSLKNLAEDYFKNLNSISSRLHYDLEEVKSSYEGLWATIPEKEQQTILSESIIKPELTLKYNPLDEHVKFEYGVKMIFDEHYSYRDEHSGPFSFKTQSQRDLRTFNKETESNLPKLSKNKTKLPKPSSLKSKSILLYKDKDIDIEHTSDIMDNETTSSLPKTGLDFLDNW